MFDAPIIARDALGINGVVNPCSDAYKFGGWTSLAFVASRLVYAGLAKAGAELAVSGAEASTFRQSLKAVFRFGIGKSWRSPSLDKYTTDKALRDAAGRTNVLINNYGAGVAAAGGVNGAGVTTGSGCGCQQ